MVLTALSNDCDFRPTAAVVQDVSTSHRTGVSRDEECELAGLIASGDREARNRLVQANLRLVMKIARMFEGRGLEPEDLIGEGNLGLLRAAERFDPRFGTRFTTYAVYWIKEAIRRALINTAGTIRVPAQVFQLMIRWRRAERTYTRELGRPARFDDVASALGLSERQKSLVTEAIRAGQVKHEGNYNTGDARSRLADEVSDQQSHSEDLLDFEDEWVATVRRMKHLDARERAVLALRFGLDGETLTLQEIGSRFGVTREFVRQIQVRALTKLAEDSNDRELGSPQKRRSPIKRRARNACPRKPRQRSRERETATRTTRAVL